MEHARTSTYTLTPDTGIGQNLRRERLRLNLSQEALAEAVGVSVRSVRRWEQDDALPYPLHRERLCQLFQCSPDTLFTQPAQNGEGGLPAYCNLPYRRNPCFTGRETVLQQLGQALAAQQDVVLSQAVAVSGLGGIGKTQTVVEYIYRFADRYRAIFWIKAETRETLLNSFLDCSRLLRLAKPDGAELEQIADGVKRWLERQKDWLVVFDNVEDLDLIIPLLPTRDCGHLILTTRLRATGTLAQRIDLETMPADEGARLLLSRAKMLAPGAALLEISEELCEKARDLSVLLGGLPLALDQAGAYVEETGCGLGEYRRLFEARSFDLLQRRGGGSTNDHPSPVGTTWSLSFERVAQRNGAAADLLQLCAFLHPDAIPEELFTEGADCLAADLGLAVKDPLRWNEMIEILLTYSLIHRHCEEGTLSMHRLVQAVLRDRMDATALRLRANQIVELVNLRFPEVGSLTTWQQCQQLLPHALMCVTWIEQTGMVSPAAGRLTHETGAYLIEIAQYVQAERCITLGLHIRQQVWGEHHPEVAQSLNHLAELHYYRADYQQAEQFHRQALLIRQARFGPQHNAVAESLNNLAGIYCMQGRYQEAEPLYHEALKLREQLLGPENLTVAENLQNLAYLYVQQGRYSQAEPLYLRCLSVCQQLLEHDHGYFTTILNNLGNLYQRQGKHQQAAALYQQALSICQRRFRADHPRLALTYSNLAELAQTQGEAALAEDYYLQALQVLEQNLGQEHPRTAQVLQGLALLYSSQQRVDQARELLERALGIRTKMLGPDHPETHVTRRHYAALLSKTSGERTRPY